MRTCAYYGYYGDISTYLNEGVALHGHDGSNDPWQREDQLKDRKDLGSSSGCSLIKAFDKMPSILMWGCDSV